MTIRRFFVGLFLVPLLLLGGTGFAHAKEKIRIGLAVSWPGYAFYKLVQEKNLLPGYDLEITIFEDPIAGQNMLSAGQLDVYASTMDYTPIAVENKLPIVNVAYLNPSYGVDQVVLAPGVAPKDLKGKKVAAPEAFIGQLLVGMWLERNGLKPGDVHWVNLNADEGVGPMISGDIAAAYMYEPWTSKLMKSLKGAKIVADTSEPAYISQSVFGDALYMNKNFIKKHRKAALAVLKARWVALQYWHDHTDEVNALIAKYLKWPLADVQAVIGTNGKSFKGGIYLNDFDEAARVCGVLKGAPPFGQKNGGYLNAVKTINAWWIKLGIMKTMHDPAKGVDCSLLGDLVKSGYRQSMTARP